MQQQARMHGVWKGAALKRVSWKVSGLGSSSLLHLIPSSHRGERLVIHSKYSSDVRKC